MDGLFPFPFQLEQELGSAQRALEAQQVSAAQKLAANQDTWGLERASLTQGSVCLHLPLSHVPHAGAGRVGGWLSGGWVVEWCGG